MSYIDQYNETELNKLERRLNNLYRHAFQETWDEQAEYWRKLEERVSKEYEAYQNGAYTKTQWDSWVRAQIGRGKTLDAKAADIANRLAKTGQIAADYTNGIIPRIFQENANFEAFSIEKDYKQAVSFTLVDDAALKAVATGNQIEFKARWKTLFADPQEIYAWNYDRVQTSVYQGILRGEGHQKIADRIMQVTNSSRAAAVRNARTAVGSAQNAGRQATFEKAAAMGIEIEKEWKSFHDARTRDSHAYLDGVRVAWDEEFPNGLMYPKDPNGAPAEVYNCRCTMGRVRPGSAARTNNTEKEYAEWKENKAATLTPDGHTIANGVDARGKWERRKEFDYEIEDIINYQGFDGLPRVVSSEEFDKYVKASNFIAQRTYSASSAEILDAYRDQLYNGKWYVDCGTGGAQYGKGMYCAADYKGKLTSGIKEEMRHYQALNKTRGNDLYYTETLTLDPSAKIVDYITIRKQYLNDLRPDLEFLTDDIGSYAALKGYDAINAVGHGASGSYTVVLNRTKLVIKGE